MSVLVTAEAADILNNLYLNDSYSDVEFIVDGDRLPAHRNILAQRCPVFEAMFLPNSELQNQVIEVPETPVEAFKLLLKFVYTGNTEFGTHSVGYVFEVASIAETYEMPRLIEQCIDHLKCLCSIDNVVGILNKAIEKSHETLIDHCIDYVFDHCAELVGHKSFNKLPVKALHQIFEKPTSEVSGDSVFRAFVEWMKSNPSESEHFPDLLKRLDLTDLEMDEVVGTIRPLNLVGDNVLLDLACEHAKKVSQTMQTVMSIVQSAREKLINALNDNNVSDSDSDTNIINDEHPTFFKASTSQTFKHTIGSYYKRNTIDLNRQFMLNYLEFILSYGDWSYWIEVSQDKVNWTRVIDYSKYVCRGLQRLYFPKQILRYIRVCGTAPVGEIFKIHRLVTYYTTKEIKVDPKTNIVIPSDNVALLEKGAVLLQGEACFPEGMISSTDNSYSWHFIGNDNLIVQLPQPYILDSMNLQLVDKHVYDYNIEVSTDKINWTPLLSEKKVTSWRHVSFDKQPVVFIKLTGTYSTGYSFLCKHFECPAVINF